MCGRQRQETVEPLPAAEQSIAEQDSPTLKVFFVGLDLTGRTG